jgi:hemolysin III
VIVDGVETATTDSRSRPLLRGVLHQAALVVAVAAGVVFVVETDGGRRTVAAAVFAASAATMLAVSAIYHRVTWTPRARLRMRRADHAGIYLLIAGTYTPVGLLALHGVLQKVVLGVVWTGAAAAIVLKLAWVHAPKWLSAVIAIGLGWVGVAAIPQLVRADGVTPVVLIAAGGLAYTAGGIVYARRRPDPFPAVFGYHELFHALTLVGLGLQYAAIAFFVIRPA